MKRVALILALLPLAACAKVDTSFNSLSKNQQKDARNQIIRCAQKLKLKPEKNVMIRATQWEDGTISNVTFTYPDGTFRACNNKGMYL